VVLVFLPSRSPLKEVIFAIRAILPLVVALCLLIWLLLRKPLPRCSWAVEPRDTSDNASEAATEDASVRSGTAARGAMERQVSRHPGFVLQQSANQSAADVKRKAASRTTCCCTQRVETHPGRPAAD
jgi:energy-coupling factor transporter transmembrane protein EcfT